MTDAPSREPHETATIEEQMSRWFEPHTGLAIAPFVASLFVTIDGRTKTKPTWFRATCLLGGLALVSLLRRVFPAIIVSVCARWLRLPEKVG